MSASRLDREGIDRLLTMFSRALAVRATLFDADNAELPFFDITDRSPYCTRLRRDATMDARCLNCDRSAIGIARRRGEAYIYRCHRGLWEAVVPLVGPEGRFLGSLLCGQLKPSGLRRRHDDAALAADFRRLEVMGEDRFRKVVELLAFVGQEIIAQGLLRARDPDWAEVLRAWVDEHLAEPISLARMAAQLGRSASWLSQRFPSEFGLSPMRWVNERRLRRAQALLREGGSVQETAAALGYCDPFHFSKCYKTWAGHPPSDDRPEANN